MDILEYRKIGNLSRKMYLNKSLLDELFIET